MKKTGCFIGPLVAEKRKIEWQAPGPGIPSMVKNPNMNPVIF